MNIESYAAFEKLFEQLDIRTLDEEMRQLEADKQEFCQWNVGINMETPHGFHVCREDVTQGTFFVTEERMIPSKLLGFIPLNKQQSELHENLSPHQALTLARQYFAGMGREA